MPRHGRLLLNGWVAACALGLASVAVPAFAASPALHELAAEDLLKGLWDARSAVNRAVETRNWAAVHEIATIMEEALHALEAHTESMPDARRGRTQEFLMRCFGSVAALHSAAEVGDGRALEKAISQLGVLILEGRSLFYSSGAKELEA